MSPKVKSLLIVTLICVIFIWVLPFMGFFPFHHEYVVTRTLFGVYGTIIAFIIVNILAKTEGVKGIDIGLSWQRGTLLRFMAGMLIGLVIASLIIFILVAFTDYSLVFDPSINSNKALLALLGFIPLALMEEIIFRGYPFMKLKKMFGIRITQVVMAILFAYYHDRTGATLHQQLMGPGIWAFIYGIAAVWSKGIALPTGIHAAVNMVLAIVGTKHADYALWNFDLGTANVESAEPRVIVVDYLLKIALLVVGLGLTEWWIRRKSNEDEVPVD